MYQFTYIDTILLFVVIVALLYKLLTKNNNYWKDRNVVYVQPKILFGTLKDSMLSRKTVGQVCQDYYNQYPDEKYVGLFRMRDPMLLVKDPELIKHVMIKNFHCFQNRFEGHSENNEKLSRNLFGSTMVYWKKARQKLTPTFTSGKLRNMFYLIMEKAEEFRKCLDINVGKNEENEVQELMARYTTEVIGSCAFGLKLGSMMDTEDQFRKMGKEIFNFSLWRIIKSMARTLSPTLFYATGLIVFPKHTEKFFLDTVKNIVEERQKTSIKRNDFIDLLLEIKNKDGKDDPDIDDMFMAAQTFIFFAAGFETSSTMMSSLLYELGANQEIQEKLVNEIKTVLKENNGQLTYDGIMSMQYLDMVVEEAMRKYPALGYLPRVCTSTHKLPDSDLVIEKGINIAIPVLSLHYDPKYFPDPDKFIPERFTAEAKKDRHPMVYLPFGEGPRNCIGLRFGKMQSKIGIITVLRNYIVKPSPKTKKIVFSPRHFVTSPKGGVWLNLKKREEEI